MAVYRKDNDSHRYEIPDELVDEFDQLFETYCNALRGTDAYWDAEDEFNNRFTQFMVC